MASAPTDAPSPSFDSQCVVDFGTRMMDIGTPKEALMTIYDLLEATRFMYTNQQVLHRDISEGNVLVKVPLRNMPEPIENNKKEAQVEPSSEASVQTEGVKPGPCFIGHLLDPRADRGKTSLLLVDFDRGDITDANEKPHTERTGTTIFMAKAIRNGGPHGHPGGHAVYDNVSQITAQVRAAYEAAYPDRSIRFPDSTEPAFLRVGTADQNKFRHELYHDAESAFWLLLRWALLAYPSGTPPTEIPFTLWTILTGSDADYRPYHIAPHSLNPGYRELEQLLADVGGVFKSDMHWATQEPYKHLDFAHEVFQRYILNFLVENQGKEFLDLRKADNPRPCAPSLYSDVASTFPAIERTITSSRSDGSVVSSGRREKTRICMADFGTHMMDVKTPKEALMTIYDLLETTRFMYTNQHVLHRDISEGNVLVKQPLENMPEPIGNLKEEIPLVEPSSEASVQTEGVNQPCFIGHLLNKSVDRRKTSLLLVDFDRGDIIDANEKPHTDRTGTTIFMAKAIRNGGPHGHPGGHAVYKSVPQNTAQVRATYEAAHPDRSIRFPDSTGYELSWIGTEDRTEFRHKLYHDAESAYWLLLRWAILAYPVGSTPTEIYSTVWMVLTGSDVDVRPYCLPAGSLNPGYRELEELLEQVGGVLESDMHWATQEPYNHPDFAHEAFQRRILNFIIENQDKEFMNLRKADNPRPCAPSLYYEVANTFPPIAGTISSSRSSSRSRSPSPCLDDDRTASSSASSVSTQSSGSSKRTRESEGSEPEAASSKRARGSQSESDTASTVSGIFSPLL